MLCFADSKGIAPITGSYGPKEDPGSSATVIYVPEGSSTVLVVHCLVKSKVVTMCYGVLSFSLILQEK